MTHRRRAALLLGLALALGGLAASDVARREAALDRSLAPVVPVVVARADLAAGHRVTPADLAVRPVPERFLPADALREPGAAGGELAVPVPADAYLTSGHFAVASDDDRPDQGSLRRGERIAQLLAVAPPELVGPGARVDVLVTQRRGGAGGETTLALQDVEVLTSAAAPEDGRAGAAAGPRVAVGLRVRVRDAVALAAAQSFAEEIRLLPRAPGDRRRVDPLVASGAG